MNKIILPVVIVVIAIVGIAVFFQLNKSSPESAVESPSVSPGSPNKSPVSPAKSPAGSSTPGLVKDLFRTNPGSNATAEQQKAFSSRISALAVASSVLDIESCSPNPPVIRIKYGSSLVVKNSDSISHRIFNPSMNLTVSAKSQSTLLINFLPGIYGYSCDSSGLVGIFLVTQ